MLDEHDERGEKIYGPYREKRQEAREEYFSLADASDKEIIENDLDTAGVTGVDNDETYTTRDGHDIRDDPRRG